MCSRIKSIKVSLFILLFLPIFSFVCELKLFQAYEKMIYVNLLPDEDEK